MIAANSGPNPEAQVMRLNSEFSERNITKCPTITCGNVPPGVPEWPFTRQFALLRIQISGV